MPSYKLYYFDVPGRAEAVRYLFHYGEVPFEDYRFSSEQWPEIKAKLPFGQVPVLEIDGKKMIATATSIARFISRDIKAYGDNCMERATIDALADLNQDMITKITPTVQALFAQDSDLKKTEWAKVSDDIHRMLGYCEAQLKKNGNGVLVGKRLSFADFMIADTATRIAQKMDPKTFEKTPKLRELCKKIRYLPKVKEYIAAQPDSFF